MERSLSLPTEISRALERGGTVVTGNQRAARTLRLAYDRQRRSVGLTKWEPPAVLAWETWTAQLWRKSLLAGAADRLLLNRSQELHIWRSVLSSDPRHNSLQSVESLAELAAGAWQLLCAYHGQSRVASLGVSEDTRTFQRWAQGFRQRCRQDAYLSASELEEALAASRQSLPATEILLTGFDSMTPAQSFLIDALRRAGAAVSEIRPAAMAERLSLATSETLDEELTQCATCVRDLLRSDPVARVAVIHPDIATERGEIDRVFRHVLAPELESVAAAQSGPYEFSLGTPLAQAPMVASALRLLRFASGPLKIEDLSRLLLSPWFTPADELDLRAEFEANEIRTVTLLRPQIGLNGLIRLAENSRTRAARLGNLVHQLHALQRTAERIFPDETRQKPFAEWADSIRDLLRATGWATFTRDTSTEFQTRRKWETALDELATLDFEGTRPNFAEAFARLEGLLARTLFAPESRDAPVQIMDPREAAGSRFDAVFFLRCSDLVWPLSQGTNPLLGWRLQRDLGMPGSDPALDLARAKSITQRLAASAPSVVFSYARRTEDAHQRPSPLLSEFGLQEAPPFAPSTLTSAIPLEVHAEAEGIPLATRKVRGGSAVLKNQAACAFRAFAEARLASKPLRSHAAGLDAGERGSVLHGVMAAFWGEIRSQAALRALTPDQRRDALDRAITHIFSRISGQSAAAISAWDGAYLEVQRQRLHRILGQWLEEELERAPFTVHSLEEKIADVDFGPLTLDIRIDRVDTLLNEDGNPAGEVLLDYKTGEAAVKDWHGDRPNDPQLPLYAALSVPGALAGVGFIRLRPGADFGLVGYAEEEGILLQAGLPECGSLEQQIEQWRGVLTALTEDFAAGDARVRPKNYPATCKLCAQRTLCRIDPGLLEDVLHDDEDSDAADTSEESYG